jgi:hypothetical protein
MMMKMVINKMLIHIKSYLSCNCFPVTTSLVFIYSPYQPRTKLLEPFMPQLALSGANCSPHSFLSSKLMIW